MPFKSDAQRKWMYAAEARGEVPKGTAERWQAHTPKDEKLPDHVAKKAAAFEYGYKLAANAAPLASTGTLQTFGTTSRPLGPPKPFDPVKPVKPVDKPIQLAGGTPSKVAPPPGPRDAQGSFAQALGAQALESGSNLKGDNATMPVGR